MGYLFRQKWTRAGEVHKSKKWYGAYRDKDGKIRRVPLLTDKQSARAMLQKLEQSAERMKSGFSDEFVEAGQAPLPALVSDYIDDMKLRGRSERHREDTERLLNIVLRECGFDSLGSLNASKLDKFLARLKSSARTKNTHRQAIMGFANWCVKKRKLDYNPLSRSTKPEGNAVLMRRALSIDELRRLLEAAKLRLEGTPDGAFGAEQGQSGRPGPALGPGSTHEAGARTSVDLQGGVDTGSRRGELREMRVYHLGLEGTKPKIHLPKELTKNGKDANIPLRTDFAEDAVLDRGIEARVRGPALQGSEPDPLVMQKDLELAGIAYRDDRGRVADFHSLRKCMATHLNKEGVPIVTAKELLRHGTVELTAGVYNDEESHDLRAAVAKLPPL